MESNEKMDAAHAAIQAARTIEPLRKPVTEIRGD